MGMQSISRKAVGAVFAIALILGAVFLPVDKADATPSGTAAWHQGAKGWWYQRTDGSYPIDCWESVRGQWYRFDSAGYMLTGWYKVNGEWNWSDSSGAWHANEWQHDGFGWWYSWADGTYPTSSWQLIGGKWYLFDGSGYMLSGWQRVGGTWYYLNPGGDMVVGWLNLGGAWYYLKDSGAMATGWQLVQGDWYYLDQSGAMESDWLYLLGDWYYLASDGAMRTGWKSIAGTWYYFEPSGVMATGWQDIDGNRYYLSDSGAMATGTRTICGLTHRFAASGAWIEQTGGGTPVEVKVLDKVLRSNPWGVESAITKYEYDEAGRVICSNTLYKERPSRIDCKNVFSYIGNNVSQVTSYIDTYPRYVNDPEQSEMVKGTRESFTYDSRGFCAEYKCEILSQGNGVETIEYAVDDSGKILRAIATDYPLSIDDENPHGISWSYLNNGVVERVVADGPEWYRWRKEFELVPNLTITERGRYTYRAFDGDKNATLRVDSVGNLVTAEVDEAVYTYEYKTILVDADSYIPSVFSNPQPSFLWSYDSHWNKPSLTVDEVDRILGR